MPHMSDLQVMEEIATYRQAAVVYYRHESGVVFATPMESLHHRHLFKLADELPKDAAPFEPSEDSHDCVNLDAWTDACDATLLALVSQRTEPGLELH